jgi:Fe-S-cluster-containing dehydrogenase component
MGDVKTVARYGMLVDVAKCIGCYNCWLACKDEHCGNENQGYFVAQPETGHFWIKIIERERGKFPKVKMAFIPMLCMHCESAPCVKTAKDGAVYQRPDGIVIIDPKRAAGQREILTSCPYRVIYWNKEKNLPQKCTFCAHLLDQGFKEPRCVEVCPTDAIIFGDLDDPNSRLSQIVASTTSEVLHPEFGLKGGVFYINLPKRFIAGTVVYADVGECAEGALVTLNDCDQKRTTKTDAFGDFEFENLTENTYYTVVIKAQGYKPYIFKVKTIADIYLGRIALERER